MKRLILTGLLCASFSTYAQEVLTPVSFEKINLSDSFWSNRMKIQKETLVPVAFERTQEAVEDLRRTGAFLRKEETPLPSNSRFNTSDLYKVIEGAAYLLKMERDAELENQIDEIAGIIANAQEEDGYLYPAHTAGSFKYADLWGGAGMGDKPYSWVVHSHELYNIGHLYEAAVAYYQATGKTNLLDIAEKSAKHVNKVFFEGDAKYNNGVPVNQAPGHQEIELALVKLYRVTNNPLYLDMAKKFIDIRGVTYIPDGEGTMSPEYAQQHAPVRHQCDAVGHAVRAVYLYSAMSDVGSLTADSTLNPALDCIWHNIVDTRMHITGGLGAIHGIEGFGPEYELPNKEAYNETCAAVGNVFFNHRMFLLEKDGKYMDVAEVALLNNVLAGVNLEGNKFFYVNPLESAGMVDRSHWFGTACCPTNLARLIPQIAGLMYAHTDNDIYCAFYTANSVDIPLKSGKVNLEQTTEYPFDEQIKITIKPEKKKQKFVLKLRIPTWTDNQLVPGKLYSATPYLSPDQIIPGKPGSEILGRWKIFVNGTRVDAPVVEKGFVSIDRQWKTGDVVELVLPMHVRHNHAIEEVEADRNKVAISRGPLVYCAEGIDNEVEANRYMISHITMRPEVVKENKGALKGIEVIRGLEAFYADNKGEIHPAKLNLIPYYAWNNRGVSTMNVWFAETEERLKEDLDFMPLILQDVTASHTHGGENVLSIVNGKFPSHSFDTTIDRWTSYPKLGVKQSIDFTFENPTNLKAFSVYWYDDNGGVQLPVEWSLEYKSNGNDWQPFPLYSTDSYSLLKDQFNLIHSDGDSFIIDQLRLNITPRQNSAAGILQVMFDTK